MSAFEKHYSVPEISSLWNLSEDVIRNLFHDHPDVIKIGKAETRYKRKYFTLRVPESVMTRVHQQLKIRNQ